MSMPGFMDQAQPPELPLSISKTEPLTVIKNEPPESQNEEIDPDTKNIDIVPHELLASIKSETDPETTLKSKYFESLEFEKLVIVKTENAPFVKVENLTVNENLYKTENTGDRKVNKSTDQEVIEIQAASHNLDNKQLVGNFSTDLNAIYISGKPENLEKSDETTSCEKEKGKIKVTKAPVIPVEPHEYDSLNKYEHVCKHCQQLYISLVAVKRHIKTMHREVTPMHHCPYCVYKSKWRSSLSPHIIQKHKHANAIQWYRCQLCQMRFKLRHTLNEHMRVHLTRDGRLKFCPVCGKGLKSSASLREHIKFVHNKEERKKADRKCQECEYTTTSPRLLKYHIKNTHEKHENRYRCEKCEFGTEQHAKLKLHELSHKTKAELDDQDLKYRCNKCDYKTFRAENFKRHKVIHLKPEEVQFFHCFHCSYKSNQRPDLKSHIWRHFKKENIPFHCYICDFITLKRQLIIEHIKTHSNVANTKKCEIKGTN